jgi:hypothetical protein
MKRVVRNRTKTLVHEDCNFYHSEKFQEFITNEITKKQWIYKIINGEKEQEDVIFRTDEFLLVPDVEIKDDENYLNWIVIFTNTEFKCIRCLNQTHIPLLKRVENEIRKKLPSDCQDVMMYFHYPPSVWQLHLHVLTPCNILRTTNSMQKVYFLQDVISCLSIDANFFKKSTLSYVLPLNHEISSIYKTDPKVLKFEKHCDE